MRDRGDLEERKPAALGRAPNAAQTCRIRDRVALGGHDNARARRDIGGERRELTLDHGDVLLGVPGGRSVDEVAEDAAALDVLEEAEPEPRTAVSALDEPGNVGDDEGRVAVPFDHTETGSARREGLRGD